MSGLALFVGGFLALLVFAVGAAVVGSVALWGLAKLWLMVVK